MDGTSNENLQSSEEIRKNVMKELSSNSFLKEENILVSSDGDEIILQGDVDSLDKKWLAEDIALDTFGVLRVRNEIHVSDNFREAEEVFYED